MSRLQTFDSYSTALVQSLPASLSPFMDGLSLIGEPAAVMAVATAGFIAALARGQSAEQTAFILGAIAFSVGTLLKLTLKRRRPHGKIIRNLGINSYSFPSGHAFGSMIFYGLLALSDAKYLKAPWSFALTLLVVMLIFSIGVSRVFKGAHYPSDVAAGWLLGIISLVLIYLLAF